MSPDMYITPDTGQRGGDCGGGAARSISPTVERLGRAQARRTGEREARQWSRRPQDRQYSRPGGRTRTTAIARSKRTATCLDRMEHRTTRRGGNGRGGRSPDGTAERRRSGGTAAIARSRKAATRSDRMEHRTTAGESPWEFRLNDGAPRRGEGSHKDAARRSEGNMSIYLYERRRSDGTAAPTGAHGPPPSQGPGEPPYFQTGWSTGPPRVRGNGRRGRSPAPVERRRSDGTAAPAGAHVPPPLQGPEGPLSRQDGAPTLYTHTVGVWGTPTLQPAVPMGTHGKPNSTTIASTRNHLNKVVSGQSYMHIVSPKFEYPS